MQQCQPHVPYRCMVGDLSGRLGNINLGLGRYVFSDRNLPLCESPVLEPFRIELLFIMPSVSRW